MTEKARLLSTAREVSFYRFSNLRGSSHQVIECHQLPDLDFQTVVWCLSAIYSFGVDEG